MTGCGPVLFIGLDSADPSLLIRWGLEGLLPVLHSLRQRSMRAEAVLAPGLGSGAMWVSIFSGVSPARHGRYFGRQLDREGYRVVPFDQGELTQEPVWLTASRCGKRAAVIDIPVAPLAQQLDGIQIKDWGLHDPVYPSVRTFPPELADEVTHQYGVDPVGSCDMQHLTAADFRQFRDRLLARVKRKSSLACDFLKSGGWDLFMVGFGDAHCVSHQAWHLHDSNHPLFDAEFVHSWGNPVRDVYQALDSAVGEILDAAPVDTTVMLFSGSGMGPNYTGNHLLDEALRRLEGAEPTPARRAVESIKGIYRAMLPESVRSRLGALGDRVDEMSLAGDRARRRFYAIPHNDLSGAIRINVAGREPEGRVRPGEEFDCVCQALRDDLMALRDPDSGRPVVTEVLQSSSQFQGPYRDQLPDLLVVWDRKQPIQAIESEKIGEVRGLRMSKRTGDHLPTGEFLAAGPGIKPGDLSSPAAVEHVAPTIAAWLDIPMPDVDGEPIREMCGWRGLF